MRKQRIFRILLPVLAVMLFVLPVFANAAEPPCLTVVVVDAPEDLALALVDEDGNETVQLRKKQSLRGWETYFRFFYNPDAAVSDSDTDLPSLRLAVTTGGETVFCEMPANAYDRYNNVVQLDIASQRVKTGLYPGRMVLIIGMRVALTLLIEGILFWAFGFRQKYSWGMFFVINILTQLGLNLLIGGAGMDSYVLFFYWILEGIICIAEAVAFPLALEEHRRRAIPYAILANLASMFLGGLMIANLPLAL